MIRRDTKLIFCLTGLMAMLGLANEARAATYTVQMVNFAFQPPTMTIGVGDTIVWNNGSGFSHSATGRATNSPAEAFCGAGTFSSGTCSFTFNDAGRFGYYCVLHDMSFGMNGTITVTNAANTPPSVSLTNPVSNAKFKAPAVISLKATASDPGGSVTNVQFFSGGALLGNVAAAPYNFNVSNVAAGNYTFTARALDNQGAATTSAVVNVFVLTNAVLTSPTRLPGGQFKLTVLGIANQTYATERSSNFVNWTAFSTNVAPANSFNVTDTTSTNVLFRFYRARQDL
ncbi:MAG: hypothetical protein EPO07_10205 [Verrucomicrobia bacterium]|nr:MAG: hypothetical protein EPO07_10205 [Verrucomicrobiota bacterium]